MGADRWAEERSPDRLNAQWREEAAHRRQAEEWFLACYKVMTLEQIRRVPGLERAGSKLLTKREEQCKEQERQKARREQEAEAIASRNEAYERNMLASLKEKYE